MTILARRRSRGSILHPGAKQAKGRGLMDVVATPSEEKLSLDMDAHGQVARDDGRAHEYLRTRQLFDGNRHRGLLAQG